MPANAFTDLRALVTDFSFGNICRAGKIQQMLTAGAPRIAPAFRRFADAIAAAAAELDKTWRALEGASRHPSGKAAITDIYAQLEELFSPDLMKTVPLGRLEHFPRYLRAAQARLGRAVADPRKDAEQLAPFTPLWAQFLEKRARARDAEAIAELRWAFEELRVAIFAPELKTPVPVSVAKVTAAMSVLGR